MKCFPKRVNSISSEVIKILSFTPNRHWDVGPLGPWISTGRAVGFGVGALPLPPLLVAPLGMGLGCMPFLATASHSPSRGPTPDIPETPGVAESQGWQLHRMIRVQKSKKNGPLRATCTRVISICTHNPHYCTTHGIPHPWPSAVYQTIRPSLQIF